MPRYSSQLTNPFRQLSTAAALTRASQNSDDTIATASSIGSLSASSSPVSFRLRGQLNRSDQDDFFKLQILPGAAYSSIGTRVRIRGANVRLITSFEIPGSPPQQASVVRLRPGNSSNVNNTPFANTFGVPLQIYLQVRRTNPRKRVSYNLNVTFNP